MNKIFWVAILGLALVLAPNVQAQETTGLISLKACWLTEPIGPNGPDEDKCDRLGDGIRVEVRAAEEAGKYRQSANSPWLINYSIGKLIFATITDERGRLLLELPPGNYFIRPLGENYHSPGGEFFQIKPGARMKATLFVLGNI